MAACNEYGRSYLFLGGRGVKEMGELLGWNYFIFYIFIILLVNFDKIVYNE